MSRPSVHYTKQRLLFIYQNPLHWIILIIASGYSAFSVGVYNANVSGETELSSLIFYLLSNWSILTYGFLFLFVLSCIFQFQNARFTLYIQLRLTRADAFLSQVMTVSFHTFFFLLVSLSPSLIVSFFLADTVNFWSIQRFDEIITILYLYLFLCAINVMLVLLGLFLKYQLAGVILVLAYIFVYPTLIQLHTGLQILPFTPQANILLIHRGDQLLSMPYLSSLFIIVGLLSTLIFILYHKERNRHVTTVND